MDPSTKCDVGMRVKFSQPWSPDSINKRGRSDLGKASFHQEGDEVIVAQDGGEYLAVRTARMRATSFYWVPKDILQPVS